MTRKHLILLFYARKQARTSFADDSDIDNTIEISYCLIGEIVNLIKCEVTGYTGEQEGSLAKIGLIKYEDQNEALEELCGLIDIHGALNEHTQILLLGLLMNRPEVDELIRKITPTQKAALKKFLIRNWGWINDFGNRGGLDRIYGSEATELKERARHSRR